MEGLGEGLTGYQFWLLPFLKTAFDCFSALRVSVVQILNGVYSTNYVVCCFTALNYGRIENESLVC